MDISLRDAPQHHRPLPELPLPEQPLLEGERRLNPAALQRARSAGALTIVDVREPSEFRIGHIPGSVNIPLGQLAGASLPAGPLVLVCRSGVRSLRGLQLLHRQGRGAEVSDLDGGIRAWRAAGLPLERLCWRLPGL